MLLVSGSMVTFVQATYNNIKKYFKTAATKCRGSSYQQCVFPWTVPIQPGFFSSWSGPALGHNYSLSIENDWIDTFRGEDFLIATTLANKIIDFSAVTFITEKIKDSINGFHVS